MVDSLIDQKTLAGAVRSHPDFPEKDEFRLHPDHDQGMSGYRVSGRYPASGATTRLVPSSFSDMLKI